MLATLSMKERSCPTRLRRWFVRRVDAEDRGKVLVEGEREADGAKWHSSAIAEREDFCKVKTASGSVYELVGHQDCKAAVELGGLLEKEARAFKRGFPEDWLDLLRAPPSKPATKTLKRKQTRTKKRARQGQGMARIGLKKKRELDDFDADEFLRNLDMNALNQPVREVLAESEEEEEEEDEDDIIIEGDDDDSDFELDSDDATPEKSKENPRKMKMNEKWNVEENRLLRRGHALSDPTSKDFWKQVSRHVPGRNAQECYNQWFLVFLNGKNLLDIKRRRKNSKKILKRAAFKNGKLAGKHTAKFRQQVREVFEDSEKKHADDLFASTPFQKKLGEYNVEANVDTPIGPASERRLSEQKSDSGSCSDSEADESEFIDRKKADFYIAGMAKRNKEVARDSQPLSTECFQKTRKNMAKVPLCRESEDCVEGAFTPGGGVRIKIQKEQIGYEMSDDDASFFSDEEL